MARVEWDTRDVLVNADTSRRTAEQLLASESDILLKWHEILKAASGMVNSKRQNWIELLNLQQSPLLYDPWTDAYELCLENLQK